MQRPDLLRSAEKRANRIPAPIVELEDIIERRGLAVAEIGRGLRDLPKTLRAPQTRWNGLAAEIAVSLRAGVVAEVTVDVEVAVGDRRIADQRLIGRAPLLGGIGVRREVLIDAQADDMVQVDDVITVKESWF